MLISGMRDCGPRSARRPTPSPTPTTRSSTRGWQVVAGAGRRPRKEVLVRARTAETPGRRCPIARLCSTGIAADARVTPLSTLGYQIDRSAAGRFGVDHVHGVVLEGVRQGPHPADRVGVSVTPIEDAWSSGYRRGRRERTCVKGSVIRPLTRWCRPPSGPNLSRRRSGGPGPVAAAVTWVRGLRGRMNRKQTQTRWSDLRIVGRLEAVGERAPWAGAGWSCTRAQRSSSLGHVRSMRSGSAPTFARMLRHGTFAMPSVWRAAAWGIAGPGFSPAPGTRPAPPLCSSCSPTGCMRVVKPDDPHISSVRNRMPACSGETSSRRARRKAPSRFGSSVTSPR